MANETSVSIPSQKLMVQSDRQLVLVTCLVLTVSVCAGIAAFFWNNNPSLSIGVAFASAAAALAFVLLKTGLADSVATAIVLLVIVFYAIHYMSYTSAPDDIGVYWYYATILGAFFFLGAQGGTIYCLLCFVGILAVRLYAPGYSETSALQLSFMALSILVTGVVALFYELAVSKRTRALGEALQQVQHLATTDYLTGVRNRRNFIALGEALFQQPEPLTAITLDIDNFKHCNDNYGHAAGDKVLCAMVNAVQRHLRKDDIFGRTGGEEFAILLPVNVEIGRARAEEIRRVIAGLNCRIDDLPVTITVSMGVAMRTSADKSLDALLSRADQALYAAKRSGKNCVAIDNVLAA